MTGEAQNIVGGLELDLIQLHAPLLRQKLHGEKAHVVPGILILLAGISQACHQPVHGGGLVSKQHKCLLLNARKGGKVTLPALRSDSL